MRKINFLYRAAIVFLISAVPLIELRGGIIFADKYFSMPPIEAIPISILGTMLPVPFILLLFQFVLKKLRNVKFIGPFLQKINDRAVRNSTKLGKFAYVGLAVFVAIPLPGTGAWSASVISTVLGLRKKYSIIAIFIGIIGCAAIMYVFSYGVLSGIMTFFSSSS